MKKRVFGVPCVFVVKLEKLDNAKYPLKLSVLNRRGSKKKSTKTGLIDFKLLALHSENMNIDIHFDILFEIGCLPTRLLLQCFTVCAIHNGHFKYLCNLCNLNLQVNRTFVALNQ